MQPVSEDSYTKLIDTYAGVNEKNLASLAERIRDLDLGSLPLPTSRLAEAREVAT